MIPYYVNKGLNRLIREGEEIYLPCKRITNKLKEGENNFSPFKSGLCIVTSFQRLHSMKGVGKYFIIEKYDKNYIIQGSKGNTKS